MLEQNSQTVLRIAVVQMPMAADLQENLDSIRAALAEAAEAGADLVLFPECAVTGFHRYVKLLCDPPRLDAALAGIREAVDAAGIAAVVGSPEWHPDGFWNATVLFQPQQIPQISNKVGLTPSETRFFTPGDRADAWVVAGRRVGVVMCREILDGDALIDHYSDGIDVLVWPGCISFDAEGSGDDYLEAAQDLARDMGAHLIQCNWPHSLNDPTTRGMGGSVWIGPDGTLQERAPMDRPSLTIWTVPVRPTVDAQLTVSTNSREKSAS